MFLDEPAAISLTSTGISWGAKDHGRDTPFHPHRFGKRRPHRTWQDRALGGDPIDRVDFGRRRSLGMSYRRAWLLVEEINDTLREPAVTAETGGPQRRRSSAHGRGRTGRRSLSIDRNACTVGDGR